MRRLSIDQPCCGVGENHPSNDLSIHRLVNSARVGRPMAPTRTFQKHVVWVRDASTCTSPPALPFGTKVARTRAQLQVRPLPFLRDVRESNARKTRVRGTTKLESWSLNTTRAAGMHGKESRAPTSRAGKDEGSKKGRIHHDWSSSIESAAVLEGPSKSTCTQAREGWCVPDPPVLLDARQVGPR